MYILHRNSPNAERILLDSLTLRIRSVVCKLSNWEMDGWRQEWLLSAKDPESKKSSLNKKVDL